MPANAKLTKWIKLRGGNGAPMPRAIRFSLPAGARLDDSAVFANMIGIRLRSPDDSPPDLLLTCQPAANFGGTLRSALRQQRAAAAKYVDRRLRCCASMSLRQSRCGHVEILDQDTGDLKVSYMRIIDTAAVVFGYLARPRTAARAELDRAARTIIASVETQNSRPVRRAAPAGHRGVTRFDGFSASLPDGWERQDTMGLVMLFGPGDGFRPRIVIDNSDDDGEDWDSPNEPLDMYRMIYRGLWAGIRFAKLTSVNIAGLKGKRMAFRGKIKRNGERAESIVIVIPYRNRGTVLQYMAKASDFKSSLGVLRHFLSTIKWRR